jgi:hypothetical protein
MPNRRRASPKSPPVDLDRELDEMYSSPITRPNLGFLRVAVLPHDDTPSKGPNIDVAGGSLHSTQISSRPPDAVSMDDRLGSAATPNRSFPEAHTADKAAIDGVSMDVRPSGKWKVHHCSTVQDGHSANEQLLYEMLWRSAKPASSDDRLISISREDMAGQTRITVRNIKGVLDRLIEKLSVERVIEPNSFARAAATYRIYSYRTILERRRSAGLEWVTRANGVKFISAGLAQEILSRPKFGGGDVSQPRGTMDHPSNVSLSNGILSKDVPSMDGRSRLTSPVPSQGGSSSSFPADLGAGLRKINPAFDSAAVARLWRECRARIADCTVEEVLHFVGLKASKLRSDRSVRNTIGLLLMSVPEFFDTSTIQEFRTMRQQQLAEEMRLAEETQRYWRGVLEDPNTTDEDRAMALEFVESSTRA